ncbi:MAG: mechanosensitive ion channel family protein [Lachnospiraceae bacterium]|nr:mechanosensitive ion channel family protein [Lachnospiraceae bacterium]
MEGKKFTMLIAAVAVLIVAEVVTAVLKKAKTGNHRAGTVLSLVRSLIRYAAAFFIIFAILDILGLDPQSIIAGIGILALIVGFCAESLIEDMITGIFIIFENQYNVGDIVEVSGFRGTVTDMGIRTTAITDVGGNVKIFNNSDMKNILNRSQVVSKAVCDMTLPNDVDLETFEAKVPALLSWIYERNKGLFLKEPEYLGVQTVGTTVTLRFTADVDEKNIYDGQRALNHDLLIAFRKAVK